MNEDVFPIQDGDFPASYVCLPEGISSISKTAASIGPAVSVEATIFAKILDASNAPWKTTNLG